MSDQIAKDQAHATIIAITTSGEVLTRSVPGDYAIEFDGPDNSTIIIHPLAPPLPDPVLALKPIEKFMIINSKGIIGTYVNAELKANGWWY